MPSIKSVFSAGSGKVKEVAGLQYNSDAGGSLDVNLPISSTSTVTATGLSAGAGLIDGASLNIGSAASAATSFAVATTSAGAGDTALATAGYVDAQVNVIASGVSLQKFTVAATTNLAEGQVVCLASGTNEPLARADKDSDPASNAIGIIKLIDGLEVTVQLDAEIAVSSDLAGMSVGEPVFVGANGAVIAYADLGSGDFATQVGYVSDVAGDKIVIVLKTFGELA
jgi:carbonic anhydrase/acetyltransferase-like protein (isoleucine patch superfamily)